MLLSVIFYFDTCANTVVLNLDLSEVGPKSAISDSTQCSQKRYPGRSKGGTLRNTFCRRTPTDLPSSPVFPCSIYATSGSSLHDSLLHQAKKSGKLEFEFEEIYFWGILYPQLVTMINPLAAKLFNLNFHPLEVVSR